MAGEREKNNDGGKMKGGKEPGMEKKKYNRRKK